MPVIAASGAAALPDLPPGAPADAAAIEAWLAPIVPAAELAATPQDSAFHAEGDVWTHTKLAIQALVDSPAYAAAAPEARRIVAARCARSRRPRVR